MSRKVRAIDPGTPVSDLKALMEMEGFHHLLVMRDDKLLGIISDRDVANRKGRHGREHHDPAAANDRSTSQLSQVITLALQRRISCVPVTEDGFVKGILASDRHADDAAMPDAIAGTASFRDEFRVPSVVLPTAAHSMPDRVASPVKC